MQPRILMWLGGALVIVSGGAGVLVGLANSGDKPLDPALPSSRGDPLDPALPSSRADSSRPLAAAKVNGVSFLLAPPASEPGESKDLCLKIGFAGGETAHTCGSRDSLLREGYSLSRSVAGSGTKTMVGLAPQGKTTVTFGGAEAALQQGFYNFQAPEQSREIPQFK